MTSLDQPGHEPDEHPSAALVRKLYGALAAGDIAAALEVLDDNAIFHVGGDSIVAGEYVGKHGIAELGIRILEETDGTYRTELRQVLANNSHAVTLHRWVAERRGRSIDMNNFNVYRFHHGKIVERWEFIEDQESHDAFWAP